MTRCRLLGSALLALLVGSCDARDPSVSSAIRRLLDDEGSIGFEGTGGLIQGRVALDGDTAVVTDFSLACAAYVFVRSGATWSLQQTLRPPAGPLDGVFGVAVALHGDTLVVGASDRPNEGRASPGAAYVFVRSGAAWSLQQTLGDPAASKRGFGYAVALDGDTLAVGTTADAGVIVYERSGALWTAAQTIAVTPPTSTPTATGIGRVVALRGDTLAATANLAMSQDGVVHVFTRSGAGWVPQQTLVGVAGSSFGLALGIDGDTLAVGEPGSGGGRVHVYQRSGSSWDLQQSLVGDPAGALGYSIAVEGDTLLAGDPFGRAGAATPGEGGVRAFVRSDASWSLQQILVAAGDEASGPLGTSVALSGDTAVAGVRQLLGRAAAPVFVEHAGAWAEQQRLVGQDGPADDGFGWSVGASGGVLIAGAPGYGAQRGSRAGAAQLCFDGRWDQGVRLTPRAPAAGDELGRAVAFAAEVGTAFVGAPGRTSMTGAVLVFASTAPGEDHVLTASDGAPGDRFGDAVASLWSDRLAIGAPLHDPGGLVDAGAVYAFSVWSHEQKLLPADGAAADHFGQAVAIDEDTLLVGAPGADPASRVGAGAAYVFVRTSSGWAEQQKLVASDGAAGDAFGRSVGVSDEWALIGAPQARPAGAAYLFFRDGSRWTERQKLVASDGAPGDAFGRSVGISWGTAVVGAPGHDPAGKLSAGAAYLFSSEATAWQEREKLVASDGQAGAEFGFATAISTLLWDEASRAAIRCAVGAPHHPRPELGETGAVYGFQRVLPLTGLPCAATPGCASQRCDDGGCAGAPTVDGDTPSADGGAPTADRGAPAGDAAGGAGQGCRCAVDRAGGAAPLLPFVVLAGALLLLDIRRGRAASRRSPRARRCAPRAGGRAPAAAGRRAARGARRT